MHAIVVPRAGTTPSSEELRSFCRTRLTGYKVPKQFELVDALAGTATPIRSVAELMFAPVARRGWGS